MQIAQLVLIQVSGRSTGNPGAAKSRNVTTI
jgi:hypothetical protein